MVETVRGGFSPNPPLMPDSTKKELSDENKIGGLKMKNIFKFPYDFNVHLFLIGFQQCDFFTEYSEVQYFITIPFKGSVSH